jgi:enoyl-CoA hydratase/3-hydroxyacyl-CoA dehydrogenase
MTDIESIKHFVVVGAGTMGREIAQVALMSNQFEKISLIDLNNEILNKAKNFIRRGLDKIESKGRLLPGLTTINLMKQLYIGTDINPIVKTADLIVEAIPEIMSLKKNLFKDLAKFTTEHTIVASNTSTMSITEIASAYKKPENVVGMHFFTPIPLLRLIELIRGSQTSQKTYDTCYSIAQNFPALKGKRLIAKVEKESPGFIVNRLNIAGTLFLSWLLDYASEKNIPIDLIDNDFLPPPELGPLAKMDYLGLDIVFNTMKYFAETISPLFEPGRTLTAFIEQGHLGRKTGKGIYDWIDDKPIRTNKKANLFSLEHYYAVQLNEGCRLLEEKIVSGYKIIDDAMLAGMDMPGPFGSGKRNYEKWSKMLEELAEESGINYLKPCDLMKSGGFLRMRK